MVYIFFDKKSSGSNISGGPIKSETISNQQLPEELHEPIIEILRNLKYTYLL